MDSSPQNVDINLDVLSVGPLIFEGAQFFTSSPLASHSTFLPTSVQPRGKESLGVSSRGHLSITHLHLCTQNGVAGGGVTLC